MEEQPLEDGEILLIIDASKHDSRYAECFSAEQAARLLEHKSWDHQMPLQDPYTKMPIGAIHQTTWQEDEALRKFLQGNILTGKVRHSCSTATAPILFAHKKDRYLRLCIDYRWLNRLTIRNQYSITLISKLLDKTRGGKWFPRLDLKNKYNLIGIAVGEEWKTDTYSKQGLFEYTVMPFGLTNTLASFQEMIDTIFKDIAGCI